MSLGNTALLNLYFIQDTAVVDKIIMRRETHVAQ